MTGNLFKMSKKTENWNLETISPPNLSYRYQSIGGGGDFLKSVSLWCADQWFWSCTNTLKFFLAGLFSIHSPPILYLCLELPWPSCRIWHFALLNFMRFTQATSVLSRSLCMASLPSSLLTVSHNSVPSTNLQRVHTIPLCGSPAMTVNRPSPNPNPSGMSLVTDLHLDINPLTIILCMSYMAWHTANFLSTEWVIYQIHISPV